MTSIKQLTKAIEDIAEFLNEPYEFTDTDTGEVTVRNQMWYPQKRILNGIAYTVTKALESADSFHAKAQMIARKASREHTGDEITELQLQKALDALERSTLQVQTLNAMKETAFSVYQKTTGEELRMSSLPRSEHKVDPANLSEAQKRARILLGTGEGNLAGGVDAAPWEAVA
jgi:hypothetical protein